MAFLETCQAGTHFHSSSGLQDTPALSFHPPHHLQGSAPGRSPCRSGVRHLRLRDVCAFLKSTEQTSGGDMILMNACLPTSLVVCRSPGAVHTSHAPNGIADLPSEPVLSTSSPSPTCSPSNACRSPGLTLLSFSHLSVSLLSPPPIHQHILWLDLQNMSEIQSLPPALSLQMLPSSAFWICSGLLQSVLNSVA